jgi:hypothetical protein
MDYDYILNKVFTKAEYFIIKQFKEFKTNDRPFPHAIDEIRSHLTKKYGNNLIGKNYNLFERCYRFFCLRKDYYGDTTSISKIIENEIKKEFEEVIKINKAVDKNYNVIDNYSFNRFIYDLITYHSLRKIEERLGKNSDLYKLLYNSGDYSSFTLEAFDGHVINSELYKNLFSKIHPDKFIPFATDNINEYGNVKWTIIIDNPEVKLQSIEEKISGKKIFQDFEVDEQLLILNLCLIDKNVIPLTEKIKLLILIGVLKDKTILHESSSTNTAYQKVNKGIYRLGSLKTMVATIDSILNKFEKHQLQITKQTLKKHRSTIITEQSKTKYSKNKE